MIVDLATLHIPPQAVHEAAVRADVIRQLNRNVNAAKAPVQLVTDDIAVVRKHIILGAKDDQVADECLGLTWHRPRGSYIWLSTDRKYAHSSARDPYDLTKVADRRRVIQTLIHELAHAMVGGRRGHGWTFRRMYVLLIELVGNPVFTEWIGLHFDPHSEAFNVIERYQRTGYYHRPMADSFDDAWSDSYTRKQEEVAKHMAALGRMAKRYDKIHVLG